MNYPSGLLLLASILALGQAAPVSINPFYEPFHSKLSELAKSESVNLEDILGVLRGVFNNPQARDQLGLSWGENEVANAEESINFGDLASAIGALIDTFRGGLPRREQPSLAITESFSSHGDALRDVFREHEGGAHGRNVGSEESINFGDLASAIGALIDTFRGGLPRREQQENANAESFSSHGNALRDVIDAFREGGAHGRNEVVNAEEAVSFGDFASAIGALIDSFRGGLPREQLSASWGEKEKAIAESFSNHGDALRDVIDAFREGGAHGRNVGSLGHLE